MNLEHLEFTSQLQLNVYAISAIEPYDKSDFSGLQIGETNTNSGVLFE